MDFARVAQWLGLLAASGGLAWLLDAARLPAALLLGPMLCAVALGVSGASVRVPRPAFMAAQSLVGCLIARSITGDIVASVARDWPAMLLVVATTILSGAAAAWVLGRYGSLPGTVAAWGSSPGGASAMVAMAEEFGADPRLVAFMQYVRVVCVVVTASLVARLFLGSSSSPLPADALPVDIRSEALSIAETLAIAAGGAWLGPMLRIPAGGLMGPMLLGAVLHATGIVEITIPGPLLALGYTMIGWYVGLRFTRETLLLVWRLIPQVLAATLAMIALGAVSAWLLIQVRHTDPLTAYLATSPGGIDSVAIIAVGSSVDVGFVMALQTMRVLVVVLTGAPLAKLVARLSARA